MMKYVNHLNEEIDFSAPPYLLVASEAYDYNWNFDTVAINHKKSKIKSFKRSSKSFSADLLIKSNNFEEAMNTFLKTVEKDVLAEKPGKLVKENGEYLTCYIVEARNETFHIKNGHCQKKIKIVSPYPFWIKEITREFFPQNINKGEEPDYFKDYDYDYATSNGIQIWTVDHYAPSEFQLTIFGPAINPQIIINGHPYQIYETLDNLEYAVIDSRENTITKYLVNGKQTNLYDMRLKEYSIFEPIQAGRLVFSWEGSFGFSLKLFCERSEPVW